MIEFEKDVVRAHVCCINNREKLLDVKRCGCFYCLEIFEPKLINEWCDDGKTAICPYCGIDSIIYDNEFYPAEKSFLEKMHKYWF